MILKQCLLYENECYQKATRIMDGVPAGIVIHSTDKRDPYLRRYIQPSYKDKQRDEILADIGENIKDTHWNRPAKEMGRLVCVHAFIGKNTFGDVETYQTLPYDYCCRGVSIGTKGSYNFNPQARIQVMICAGNRRDKSYFQRAWQEAAEFCAHMCSLYGLTEAQICSHKEAYRNGYAEDRDDPEDWFAGFQTTMEAFRHVVGDLLAAMEKQHLKETLHVGDVVSFTGSSQYRTPYASAERIPCKPGDAVIAKFIRNPIYTQTHSVYVKAKSNGESTADGWVDLRDIQKGSGVVKTTDLPYKVHTTGCGLNIRYGPGTNYSVARISCGRESFTIVEEATGMGASKWGKVEGGEGWVSLDFVRREG